MIRVALIGIGGMGTVHFNAYKTLKDCQLIAVADVRKEMALEKVKDTAINVYSTLAEVLLNENPDVIDICTPSYLHTQLSIEALNAGKHVLCEKPMSLTSEDAKKIKLISEKNNKLFMTTHVLRFMNAYIYLRSIIESNELGKLIRLDMKRISGLPRWSWENWMEDLNKSGGTPIDLAIHDIDFVQSVFGKNPDKTHSLYHKKKDDNDYFLSEMIYGNCVVTTEATWYNAFKDFIGSYRAVFQNGVVEATNGKITKNGEEINLFTNDCEENPVDLNIKSADGYTEEIQYFISCVKNSTTPEKVTTQSTIDTMELIEKLISDAVIIE